MLKKKIAIIACIGIFLLVTNPIFADDEIEDVLSEEELNQVLEVSKPEKINDLKMNSRAAVVYDRISKQVIWGKNQEVKRPMASTTKIMTALIVIENGNLEDIVEISKKAAGTGGSRLKMKTGDKVKVRDLLYGLMLVSGNDCAIALSEYVAGSVEGFADKMNQKALELKLENTHFVTPHRVGCRRTLYYCKGVS